MPKNMPVIVPRTRIVHELGHREHSPHYRWVTEGQEEVFVEIQLDHDRAISLMHKAAKNKNGSATLGALRARVLERRKI